MASSEIDSLLLEVLVDDNDSAKKITNIAKSIERLNKAVSRSGNLDKLTGKLNSISPTIASSGGSGSSEGSNKKDRASKNFNIFSTLGKLNYYVNMARYYGRALGNTVQYAMDYVETQNLWQVANRNNLEMADEFIQKMNKAYGISEQTLMNYQAIFKNMLSALGGINDEISSKLSMQITQMAVDFSSLYNVAIPSAMNKFQAVLSGQVRPIRSVSGYDITENTIFDLYSQEGGEKSMRQLSQMEKRLLRIVAIFDQMGATGATGDMAKTIESASNQARILAEQTKETVTWAGQLMLLWINNTGLMQKMNAVIITTKEIIKSMAYDAGYKEENFLDGLMTSAEGADEAIDKLQGKLLSFDRFEALNSNDNNALGIDETVLNLLGNINLKMADFEMEATKISNKWLETMGYVYDTEKGIYVAGEKTEKMYSALKLIGGVLAVIATYSIGNKLFGKITGGASSIFGFAKDTMALLALSKETSMSLNAVAGSVNGVSSGMLTLGKAFQFFTSPLGIVLSLLGVLYFTNDNFRESVNDLFKSIMPLLDLLFDLIGSVLKPLIPLVSTLAEWIGDRLAFQVKGFTLSLNVAMFMLTPFVAILEFLLKVLQSIVQVLGDLATFNWGNLGKNLSGIWNEWNFKKYGQSTLNNIGESFSAFATGGFPEDGFFYANSGELVGQFSNGKTAVANNEQIVQGITQGVYSAMMAYNAQTGGQNRNGDVYIDGTKVGRVVAKSSHKEMVRTGLVPVNR